MDIDAGAHDFLAALESGGVDDFVDFGLVPAPEPPVVAATTSRGDDELVRGSCSVSAAVLIGRGSGE